MNQMNDQEALAMLRKAGFSVSEMTRLSQLRQDYQTRKQNEAPLNYARLEFARWLVRTGRLTDQIPGEEVDTTCVPPSEPVPILKTVMANLRLRRVNDEKGH